MPNKAAPVNSVLCDTAPDALSRTPIGSGEPLLAKMVAGPAVPPRPNAVGAGGDWDMLESLWDVSWHGPCTCMYPIWSFSRGEAADGSRAALAAAPPTVRAAPDALSRSPIRASSSNSSLHAMGAPVQSAAGAALAAGAQAGGPGAPGLYGAAVAPLPAQPFAPREPSPPKAPGNPLPVPKRPVQLDVTGTHLQIGHAESIPLPLVAPQPAAAVAAAVAVPRVPSPVRNVGGAGAAAAGPTSSFAACQTTPQLGTWADRQYRLLDPVPERGERDAGSMCGSGGRSGSGPDSSPHPTSLPGSAGRPPLQAVGLAAGYASDSSCAPKSIAAQVGQGVSHGGTTLLELLQQQQVQQMQQQQQQQSRATLDDQAMAEAAWRWRFTRRWQAEQTAGPDRASSGTTDQLEEALAYLRGTNHQTTVSMQIGNTSGVTAHRGRRSTNTANMSLDGSLVMASQHSLVGTLGMGSGTLGGAGEWPLMGSGSGSFTSGPRLLARQTSGEMLAASREVASLNRRAAVVLQQQLDCEQEADRRVQESLAQGPPWVGAFIPMVTIDEWGSFRFLMLKLRDQGSRGGTAPGAERQRILLRGHNYGSEGQLVEECNREIMALSRKHGVPFEAPTVMGGGVMEWRRDRDRHLHLHSGFVMDRALPVAPGGAAAGGSRPASAADLLNLAAALARQSFPPTYRVTVLG